MLQKVKKKTVQLLLAAITIINTVAVSATNASAKVNVGKGIEKATSEITSQTKAVVPSVMGIVAIAALVFTVAKGVSAAISYHKNEPFNIKPVVAGIIGTIVASLASGWGFYQAFGI